MVRGSGDPAQRVADIRAVVAAVAPMIPIAELRQASELVDEAMARTTFIMALLLIAASIAVLLGMVGAYRRRRLPGRRRR